MLLAESRRGHTLAEGFAAITGDLKIGAAASPGCKASPAGKPGCPHVGRPCTKDLRCVLSGGMVTLPLGHHWRKMPATSQLLQLRHCCLGCSRRCAASGVLQHRQHLVTHRRRQRRQVRLPLPAVREVRLQPDGNQLTLTAVDRSSLKPRHCSGDGQNSEISMHHRVLQQMHLHARQAASSVRTHAWMCVKLGTNCRAVQTFLPTPCAG
jgi:hypothetical protein